VGLVHTSVEPMRLLSEQHAIRVEAPDRPVEGRWDGDRAGEFLTNLLSNAIRYSPAGGEILVRVEDLGAQARASVANPGLGIAPAELPRVSDCFYRVARSLLHQSGGRCDL
jgi:signal transduction histidine kinase